MKKYLAGAAIGAAAVIVAGAVFGWFWLNSSVDIDTRGKVKFAKVVEVEPSANIRAHSKIFTKKIEEVRPGVHLVVGYGLANVIVIEAPEGLIMVDTLESIRAAEGLLPWVKKLRDKTGKNITDIILTHNHPDHVYGAGVFVRDQNIKPRVWAHEATEARVHEVINVLAPITFRRAMRMFGVYLPDENFENNGIGPRLMNDDQDGLYFLRPSDVVRDRAEVVMAGEKVVLQFAPGETGDQLAVYLPQRKILLPADNYYNAFPNLYTVRGTPYRDPRQWVASIDRMRLFHAQVMIPQHSLPVIGTAKVETHLRNYRDAIQFVYDETIRMINTGLTPDEIAEKIKLPPHLASVPYLQEMYGRVEFAARSVFSGTLGWFSGDPADLRPVVGKSESQLIEKLAGGTNALLLSARAALDTQPAWALTLATHLLRLGHSDAQELRASALRKLAQGETASSVRNYFLTAAAEAEGFKIPSPAFGPTPNKVINEIPVRNFLEILTVNLKSAEHFDHELSYGFDFSDVPPVSIRIRRGIALIEDGLAADRVGSLKTTIDIFRGIAIKRLEPAKLLVSGEISVEGSVLQLQEFLGYFDPPV